MCVYVESKELYGYELEINNIKIDKDIYLYTNINRKCKKKYYEYEDYYTFKEDWVGEGIIFLNNYSDLDLLNDRDTITCISNSNDIYILTNVIYDKNNIVEVDNKIQIKFYIEE
ncbi:hypothetical protein [Romboutsia lituseburensis]|uniref:hypothetical protein n=1 Tax=Romboutsia lituseburensis TaxID=1537 RepID=UPI0022EA4E89|nr:hypothetical protein [Romboutsia lituseburensis]